MEIVVKAHRMRKILSMQVSQTWPASEPPQGLKIQNSQRSDSVVLWRGLRFAFLTFSQLFMLLVWESQCENH